MIRFPRLGSTAHRTVCAAPMTAGVSALGAGAAPAGACLADTVVPGGKGRAERIVPWRSHGDRPAIIDLMCGDEAEYAGTCAVPIAHKAGDAAVTR